MNLAQSEYLLGEITILDWIRIFLEIVPGETRHPELEANEIEISSSSSQENSRFTDACSAVISESIVIFS